MVKLFFRLIKRVFSIKHHYPTVTFVAAFVTLFFATFFIIHFIAGIYPEFGKQGVLFVRGVTNKEEKITLDTKQYDIKNYALAHRDFLATSTHATSTQGKYRWPVEAPYPLPGAILPFQRVIAFYGNLLSRQMGVLGEYDEEEMFRKLDEEVLRWETADPSTPVMPALHYIAVTAQGAPGFDGMYRARMPATEIEKVLALAKKKEAIVFLDIQVGLSTIQKELPLLDAYIKLPQVHIGIDPEFSMKSGIRPGKAVGTYDATDINFVIDHLATIVREHKLPPKILVIHRYTERMVTNYKNIKKVPEVQVVIHMDGWGGVEHKKSTYQSFVVSQPVQFTGFKLFYKNDRWDGNRMLTEEEILNLNPRPIYIQYQ